MVEERRPTSGGAVLATPRHRVLEKMLERLYAALATGPSLNCRPHHSRQRVDLAALARLDGTPPDAVLAALLGEKACATLSVRAPTPAGDAAEDATKGEAAPPRARAEEEQQALLRKLATIVEDARTFEQDTGAHALHVGFPLLHLPPSGKEAKALGGRRILAPVAFVPVRLVLRKGRVPGVQLEGAQEGADRVLPNTALLSWLEAQTGQKLGALFADAEGREPWRELGELVAAVARLLELPVPPLGPGQPLVATPRAEDDAAHPAGILPAAVLGLYPLSNQSLLDDVKALVEGEPFGGPLESFLRADVSLAAPPSTEPSAGPRAAGPSAPRGVGGAQLVSLADPCQAGAVRVARESRGLVVHGPPGTGKSQTIANIIGDHLARGERVLLVCDKRTALDVVRNRLEALGLGGLCAVVHDAGRDQRDLYMGIRGQLEALPEARENPAALAELARVDGELHALHGELTRAEAALSEAPADRPGASFHALAGQWLELDAPLAAPSLTGVRLVEVTGREREVREALERALKEGYADNPWRGALGVTLPAFLASPLPAWRARLEAVSQAAQGADAAASADVPAFSPTGDVLAEGRARAALAGQVAEVAGQLPPERLARWARATPEQLAAARAEVQQLLPQAEALEAGARETELALAHRTAPLALPQLYEGQVQLGRYLAVARKWYGFLFFGRRAKAAALLARFGLVLGALAAERTLRFVAGRIARAQLVELHRSRLGMEEAEGLSDEALAASVRVHARALEVLGALGGEPALASCAQAVRAGLAAGEAGRSAAVVEALRRSLPRAEALAALESRLEEAGLFAAGWREGTRAEGRAGTRLFPLASSLLSRLSSVEGLLRLGATLAGMPAPLASAVEALALARADVEGGWRAVHKAALAAELSARLAEQPALQDIEPERLKAAFDRHAALEARRRELVREAILHRWTGRQRERLLAATGGRLNALGAELKRRLVVRGERVLRVRQVIAAGQETEGGDPLFDLRPVWMASPHTVAQLFPRRALFDVVIFDESSQCRLEEALPVLLRGKRVVIAGDPRQLPPTRFFESAVARSQGEAEVEDEQGLFEEQQAEVEDLLSAALNLEVDQCYLDVHYRSQNADLISFSNTHFYEARLQAIPGHPRNRARTAPLRLVRVDGTYEKRVNLPEARAVGAVVRELLMQPQPPSVGVACFNLSQRDAIVEVLEDMAAQDAAFAARLAEARARTGAGGHEGLFVKNLENVQGDERDHIVISTTYGPDRQGRFYRRFGPLAQAGGGRRLNVLVTRARQQVHLVTSIPREQYLALPPVEEGRAPNGAWLLFAYLQHAEQLAGEYAEAAEQRVRPAREVAVHGWPSGAPSRFAQALAGRLAREQGVGSEVHWGNDGFCVDVALAHPTSPGDVTVGVLCDAARYPKAEDRVEWDLFRTAVLQSQGWRLVRLWTPHFFRDPEGALAPLLQAAGEQVARELPQAHVTQAGGPPERMVH